MQPGLAAVPKELLEDHVLDRIKHFAVVFAQELVPGITQQQLDLAFSRTLYSLSAQETPLHAQLELKFKHNCRFLGCLSQECALCKNNPHKTCGGNDNFDEAYADNQVLKARCEAEVFVELINQVTGEAYSAPGVEVQLSVVDGDAYNEAAPEPLATIMELHTSDEGVPLMQCYGSNRAIHVGTVVVSLQNGRAKLPDVFITDKNDTFHFNDGATTSRFRLLALAMRRDEMGNPVPVEGVGPAVSNSFVVKTQRALNDYRKSAYPHYKDELTRLRYIGAITANRLKDARAWLGRDVPLECVDSVQTLKQLLEYADTNRQVEQKLLELLNMRGRHRHKWDFLRSVLAEKVVYDDNAFRVWYAPESNGCGLLYATKQAQIQNMEKPAGVAQRVQRQDGSAVVQVMMLSDVYQHPQLVEWRRQAEAAWREPGHPGWQVLQDEIDYVTNWPSSSPPQRAGSRALMATAQQPTVTTGIVSSGAPTSAAMMDLRVQHGLPPAGPPAAAAAAVAAERQYSNMAQQLEMQQQLQQQQQFQQLQQQQQLRQQMQGADVYPHILQDINGFGGAGMNPALDQLNPINLRSQSDPVAAHPNAAAAAAAAAAVAALRSQSAAMPLRTQSEALGPAAALQQMHAAAAPTPADHGLAALQVQSLAAETLAARSQSGTSTGNTSSTHAENVASHPIIPAVEEGAGSAFMMQHAFDAVEVALAREALAREVAAREMRRGSSASDAAGGAVVQGQEMMGMGAPGAAAAAEAGGEGAAGRTSSSTVKRGRAGGEVHAVADPDTNAVLYTTASRERHKPTARVAFDTAVQVARPISDFVSLTPEEVEALQWTHSDRPDHLGSRDTGLAEEEEDQLLGNGMNLTNTFSAALRLGDSLNVPLLTYMTGKGSGGAGATSGGRGLRKSGSDSFKRMIGTIGSGDLHGGIVEAMLEAPSLFTAPDGGLDAVGGGGADGAAGVENRSRLARAS